LFSDSAISGVFEWDESIEGAEYGLVFTSPTGIYGAIGMEDLGADLTSALRPLEAPADLVGAFDLARLCDHVEKWDLCEPSGLY